MGDWLTADDVAGYVGGASDEDRLILSTAAVKAAVERRRPELLDATADTVPGDVRLGAVMWAGLIYQQRSAPTGFDGYDVDTALADASSKRAEIFRLLGIDRGGRPLTA